MRWIPPLLALLLATPAAAADVLAVVPFAAHTDREDLAVLGPALADMLTTDLTGADGVTLVERARLDAVLAELDLQQSDFVDPASAVAVGKGVGATQVVTGGLTVAGDQLRLDARVIDVATGTVAHAVEATGTVDAVFVLERDLARQILDALGAERSGLGAGWATEEPLIWGYKLSTGRARALDGSAGGDGVGLLVEKTGMYPPGTIWIDGVAAGQPKKRSPVEAGLRPGTHEITWTRDKGGHVVKCFGTLTVEANRKIKTGDLCDALASGVSPYGSALRGALLTFDVAGEVKPSVKIDGKDRVLFNWSDAVNLAPGKHRVLLTEGEWVENEDGRKRHVEHTVCHGEVTLEPGERAAVLVSENGCSGLDESGSYSR